MKARVENGAMVMHVEGTPKEVADLAHELGFHRGAVPVPETERSQQTTLAEDSKSVEDLMLKVRRVPASEVEKWVIANPKGSASKFLVDKLGASPDVKFTGSHQRVYISAYNKVARAHRRTGIPAPTKGA